jgi:4a-hydroxytetrahydrobiopterin dehydratase
MGMIEQLAKQHCKARRGPEHALSRVESEQLIALLPGWSLSDQADRISKDFVFKDYHHTMAFVNAVAWTIIRIWKSATGIA